MKIVFMGTPLFAAVALEALAKAGHEIGYVVSQPDKAKNRGKKILPTEVKEMAQKYGLAVLQPERIKGNNDFENTIREYAPDLIVVAAYGKILPKEILEIPRMGCINIHASLLPKYRGAAPIQRAIIDGEEKTGITLMYMAEGLDTGDMIAKSETIIGRKAFSELHDELAQMGAKLLLENLDDLANGKAKREPQDGGLATYAPMIFKDEGRVDFTKSPEEIERLIRGFSGAYTMLDGDVFKIWEADIDLKPQIVQPGTVLEASNEGLLVSAGGKGLLLKTIQAAGKKKMNVADYMRGTKIEVGTILGC